MKKEEIKFSFKNRERMLELVSEKVHNHWMIWAKELLQSETNISKERKLRWENDCFLDYKNLSEEMKNLDRKFASEIINTIFKNINQ